MYDKPQADGGIEEFNRMQRWRNRGRHRLTASQESRLEEERARLDPQGSSGQTGKLDVTGLNRLISGLGDVFDARQGGVVPPGSPGVDTVPAQMSSGPAMLDSQLGKGNQEYVLPADTTAAVGIPNLNKLVNTTHTPKKKQQPSTLEIQSSIPSYKDGGTADERRIFSQKYSPSKLYGVLPGSQQDAMLREQRRGVLGAELNTPEMTLIPGEVAAAEEYFQTHGFNEPVARAPASPKPRPAPASAPAAEAEVAAAKPQSSIAFETSPESQKRYEKQISAAGGRSLGGGRYEMPADVPVTSADLARQVRLAGGPNREAFSPENVASARKAAQAFKGPDFYGGVDVRGMSGAEFQEFKGMLDKENAQRQANIKRIRALEQPGQDKSGPFDFQRPSAYASLDRGVSPSTQFAMLADAQRASQAGKLGKATVEAAKETRAQAEEGRKAHKEFMGKAAIYEQDIANNFPWMQNPGRFFTQAKEAGANDPEQAMQSLAGVQQNWANDDSVLFTEENQPITRAEAIKILNGERPFDGWFNGLGDKFYDRALQRIVELLQDRALQEFQR